MNHFFEKIFTFIIILYILVLQTQTNKFKNMYSLSITPRGSDSWDGHMNTDYVKYDYWDKEILEKRVNGVVTKYREYTEMDTMQMVKQVAGYEEFIPNVPNIIYFKEKNRKHILKSLLKRIDMLFGEYE